MFSSSSAFQIDGLGRTNPDQETDVSIAREVDKDLNAQGEDEEPTEENATGRHVAREKQREAWRVLRAKRSEAEN